LNASCTAGLQQQHACRVCMKRAPLVTVHQPSVRTMLLYTGMNSTQFMHRIPCIALHALAMQWPEETRSSAVQDLRRFAR
jgi:hypothetical protein